jgi:4-amino-4-deoxy-L-arabinose transferase-like glycosyltransferase
LLGWSELALHLAMLFPAMSAMVAVAFLARFLGASPLGAALTALFMPTVFVSSTTLMSDVLMLALWCGSLALWMWGLRRQRDLALVFGAILAGLCPLTKYFGLSLFPLLVAFSLISERRGGRWTLYLMIPIGFIVGYEMLMANLYDHHPYFDVASYSINSRSDIEVGVGVIFFGGCILPALLFSPLL